MMTFEVQTLRGSHQWITESNWDNSADALREANNLVGSCKFKGVKVIKSKLEPDNLFRETTIFRHQQTDRNRPRIDWQLSSIEPSAEEVPKPSRRTEVMIAVLCVTVVVHALLGAMIGFNIGAAEDRAKQEQAAGARNVVIYELPPVSAPGKEAGTTQPVRVKLRLELDGETSRERIEESLPGIVDSVMDNLGELQTSIRPPKIEKKGPATK